MGYEELELSKVLKPVMILVSTSHRLAKLCRNQSTLAAQLRQSWDVHGRRRRSWSLLDLSGAVRHVVIENKSRKHLLHPALDRSTDTSVQRSGGRALEEEGTPTSSISLAIVIII